MKSRKTWEIVVMGFLSAVMFAAQVVMGFLPNIELVTLLCIFRGIFLWIWSLVD